MKTRNKGSILILSLLIAGAIGLVAGTYLRSLLSESQLADLDFYTTSVLNLAEAGGETGILAINYDDWEGWQISGSTALKELDPIDVGNDQVGLVTVKVKDRAGIPTIISEAKIELDSGVTVRRQVEYLLRPRSLFGNAVTAGRYVYFFRGKRGRGNTVHIDSYDSGKGAYDEFLNREDNGNVASEAMYAYRWSNAEIYGSASTNCGRGRRNPPNVGQGGRIYGEETDSWVQIDEKRLSQDFSASFAEITPPDISEATRLPDRKTIKLGNGASAEQYRINGDLVVKSGQTLQIQGRVVLVIEDDFYVYGKVEIREPDGELVLFIKDDFRTYNKGIVNFTKDPSKLIIYSTATRLNRAYYYFMGQSDVYASIYAPKAYIDFYGDGARGTAYGAVVGDRVIFRGNYEFHFDEQLKTFSGETPSYTIEQWNLLGPTEMLAMNL